MADVLVPLGMLLAVAFLAFAMIHTGRRQREAKATPFKDFADQNGLPYRGVDDGRAREFAQGFDGLGRFHSPSLGEVIPTDVVSGTINGAEAILFRHSIRFGEGWGREWFVAGVACAQPIAEQCAIQFCKRRAHKSTMYLQDPVLKEQKVGLYDLVVRAATPRAAGKMADREVLERLGRLGGELPFRPEVQVRGNRILAYPAGRNATIADVETLAALFEFTRLASGV